MKKLLKYGVFEALIIILCCTITFQVIIKTNENGFAYAEREQNQNQTVYLGGNPIGIIANSQGLVVSEITNITGETGSFSPALNAGFKQGDLIVAVNGERVFNIERLNELIQNSSTPLNFTVIREGQAIILKIQPIHDIVHNSKRIGLILKNNIAGIGTLTFIKEDGRYGALGHRITDAYGNDSIYNNGKIFTCAITGYKRATQQLPGELLGKIDLNNPSIGSLEKNLFCGIFGTIENDNYYKNNKIKVGTKDSIVPGKAFIYTTINEESPKQYEIEIIKAEKQEKPSEKSMVIRITDKRLLSSTGGILQGMSGSPIIQNDKLIGAVTHVFTNDSKIGYGIYIDWMINE